MLRVSMTYNKDWFELLLNNTAIIDTGQHDNLNYYLFLVFFVFFYLAWNFVGVTFNTRACIKVLMS